MVKKQWVKEILENLINSKKELGSYSKREIENAILECRGSDPRTISNWFNVLWRLDYISQVRVGAFYLNFDKIAALEIKLPSEVDSAQRRLRLS